MDEHGDIVNVAIIMLGIAVVCVGGSVTERASRGWGTSLAVIGMVCAIVAVLIGLGVIH